MRFQGKVAIVTGGSRGIGRAIAMAFAREGATVAVVGRDKSHCEDAVKLISKSGGNAIAIQADVTSEADMARMAEETKKKSNRIDILVNCAAVNLTFRKVVDLKLDEWNQVIATNLTGMFLSCRAALPQMIAQKSGKIINMSSIGGRFGAAGRSPYRATKAAIINFTECPAAEVKESGIDVNAICPGSVNTDMLHGILEGDVPKHILSPEDIVPIALFLASDDSRAITGTAIDAFGMDNPVFRGAALFHKYK